MFSLVSCIPGKPYKQEGISDSRACRLVVRLWNEAHPEYRVRVCHNAHDFGSYPDVGMPDDTFESAMEAGLDPEEDIMVIIDAWNDSVNAGTVNWQHTDIAPFPFLIEY